jgi:exopolyphosphatase
MAAAIGWAYHLSHVTHNPQKAIALLQTVEDALDLRPENQLALERSQMSSRHRDLLS